MPRFGAHLSIAGGVARAIDRASAARCETLQIFTKSVGQWRGRPLPALDVEAFRLAATRHDIHPIVAHASYLINLASPSRSLWRQSAQALRAELDRAERLGLSGVVLHPGSYTTGTAAGGLSRIIDGLAHALEAPTSAEVMILLEHTAGQGTNLGHRFEHLAEIIDGLHGHVRLGVCLDTCHLLAAGYDIATPTGYRRTLHAFDQIIGFDRLALLHLNDSKHPLGSRRDRHADIGHGWVGLAAFRRLVRDPRLACLPMVLETPKRRRTPGASSAVDPGDARNLALVRRLAAPGRRPASGR